MFRAGKLKLISNDVISNDVISNDVKSERLEWCMFNESWTVITQSLFRALNELHNGGHKAPMVWFGLLDNDIFTVI